MSNAVEDIKSQVETQLRAALDELKGVTSFSDIHDALTVVTRVCMCVNKMYYNNTTEVVASAVSGAWAEAIDMLPDDDC